MKSFSKNLTFKIDFKLQVQFIMNKINMTRQVVIITKGLKWPIMYMLLRFYLFKKRLNMNSLIANKVKLQICVQFQLNFLLYALSYVPLFKLDNTTIYLLAILLYTSVLVSTYNCSAGLYNGDLQTITVFFTRNFTFFIVRIILCAIIQT